MPTEPTLGPARVIGALRVTARALLNPPLSERLVYSVAEAARLLGISRAFAYEPSPVVSSPSSGSVAGAWSQRSH